MAILHNNPGKPVKAPGHTFAGGLPSFSSALWSQYSNFCHGIPLVVCTDHGQQQTARHIHHNSLCCLPLTECIQLVNCTLQT